MVLELLTVIMPDGIIPLAGVAVQLNVVLGTGPVIFTTDVKSPEQMVSDGIGFTLGSGLTKML
jgi:hypothetical protein